MVLEVVDRVCYHLGGIASDAIQSSIGVSAFSTEVGFVVDDRVSMTVTDPPILHANWIVCSFPRVCRMPLVRDTRAIGNARRVQVGVEVPPPPPPATGMGLLRCLVGLV